MKTKFFIMLLAMPLFAPTSLADAGRKPSSVDGMISTGEIRRIDQFKEGGSICEFEKIQDEVNHWTPVSGKSSARKTF